MTENTPGTITCPFCHQNNVRPTENKLLSKTGWLIILTSPFVCFFSLFFLLLPVAWETKRKCPNCGMVLYESHKKSSAY